MNIFLQDLILRNFTLNTKYMKSVFPTGDYKLFIFMTDAFKVPLFNISVVAAFMTPNKDTFG